MGLAVSSIRVSMVRRHVNQISEPVPRCSDVHAVPLTYVVLVSNIPTLMIWNRQGTEGSDEEAREDDRALTIGIMNNWIRSVASTK